MDFQYKYIKELDQIIDTWNVLPATAKDVEAILFDSVWCSCGSPEIIVKAMGSYLNLFLETGYTPRIYTTEGLLLAYWADACDLTEHGGSVYGAWLSDKGKKWVELYNEYSK